MTSPAPAPAPDHTAVDLESRPDPLDPRNQRIYGVTNHRHLRIDVPVITDITDTLWMGGVLDGLVLPREVRHLVTLYPWERYRGREQLESEVVIRLFDDAANFDPQPYLELADWVAHRSAQGVTLVHCQAGLNRSGLVTGLALVNQGYSGEAALALLRDRRGPAVLCNPTFEAFLLSRS